MGSKGLIRSGGLVGSTTDVTSSALNQFFIVVPPPESQMKQMKQPGVTWCDRHGYLRMICFGHVATEVPHVLQIIDVVLL